MKPGPILQTQYADRFQEPQRTEPIGICGVLRSLEGDCDMALSGKDIDFIRLNRLHDPDQVGRVSEVAIMQRQPDT